MNCRRCHEGDSGALAAGFGSDRLQESDGRGRVHRLDQVQERSGESLVTFGPRQEVRASSLPLDVVSRMLSSDITLPDCDVDASTALPFSLLQDRWINPVCGSCHDGLEQPVIDHQRLVEQTQAEQLAQSALWTLLESGHQS